ncbi:MAG TPA: hypothetical protein VFL29_00005, partial [Candidatus Dormibacteraeota bacterium]|nr:hypothetical protein [Candidatus Dormibacteraeota bacterium]
MSIDRILLKAGPLAALTLALVLTTACGGSTVKVASRTSPVPSPVQDCRGATETDPTFAAPAGVEFPTLTVDGKLRDYRLFRPPTAGQNLVPLVVVLHGSPIDAQGFEDVIQFDTEAVAGGFVTADPNGCAGYWSYAERGPYQADEDFIRQTI